MKNPWAIDKELNEYILATLERGSVIFEFGSGEGSTKMLSEYYTMYSVEHDPEFLNQYDSTYIYAPINGTWYSLNPILKNMPEKYDLLLIDGPPKALRPGVISHLHYFSNGAPIILDDTNRRDVRGIAKYLIKRLSKKVIHQQKCKSGKKFMVLL